MANAIKKTKNGTVVTNTEEQVAAVSMTQFNGLYYPNKVGKYMTTLPLPTDDLERELGIDIYDRMVNDGQVNASIYTTVYQVLSHGMQVLPSHPNPADPGYKRSIEIADYIKRVIDNVGSSNDIFSDFSKRNYMDILLDQAMGSAQYGHCVSDMTFDVGVGGKLDGMAVLKYLSPKNPRNTRFVMDKFGKVPYLYVWNGGFGSVPPIGMQVNEDVGVTGLRDPNWSLVPASKFFITSHRARYGDVRGVSAMRPAYQPWYMLQNVWPEYHKFLVQAAGGLWVGTAAPDAQPIDNKDGTVTSAITALSAALDNLYNGATLALKDGYKVDSMWPTGDGSAFRLAVGALQQDITKSIMLSILATDTAKNQSGAASRVHKDISDMPTLSIKGSICEAQKQQIWKPLVALTFGIDDAREFTPNGSLGRISPEDLSSVMASMAAAGYALSPSQQQYISAMLEIPQATPDELEARTKVLISSADQPKPTDPPNTSGANDARHKEQKKIDQQNRNKEN